MAKSNTTTANTEAAPAAAATSGGQAAAKSAAPEAAAAAPAPAAVRRAAKVPREELEDQEARSRLEAMNAELAGLTGSEDEPEEAPRRTEKKARTTPPDAAHDPEAGDESTEDDDHATRAADDRESDEDADGPVIPEDESTDEDDAADGAKTDEDREGLTPEQVVKKLDGKLFKLREQRRTLQRELEQERESKKQLAAKLTDMQTLPTGVGSDLGWFAKAKSEEDVATVEARIQQQLDWCEDHEDEGWQGEDGQGNPVEWTKQDVRNHRRACRAQLALASKARDTLKLSSESEAIARKRYPFVFDPSKALHQRVLDAAKETPGINALPNKALVLGRLAVAKLIESGEFQLVKRTAPKAAVPATKTSVKKPAPPAPPSTSRRQPQEGSDLHDRIAAGDQAAYMEWVDSLIPQ